MPLNSLSHAFKRLSLSFKISLLGIAIGKHVQLLAQLDG